MLTLVPGYGFANAPTQIFLITNPETVMSFLNWKIGFEIELMAPRGLSRQDLAESIASANDAGVRRVFHPQSELSQVPGTPVFHNLTLGFEVIDRQGNAIARCVDDLTLINDLDKTHEPQPGWYRIVSDDTRSRVYLLLFRKSGQAGWCVLLILQVIRSRSLPPYQGNENAPVS